MTLEARVTPCLEVKHMPRHLQPQGGEDAPEDKEAVL